MTDQRKPLVSVVMPVYNTEKYLAEAIESILAQTLTDFEFIIVDDGSSDGSPAISRSYAERDSRIRLIELPDNLGDGPARGAGLAAAGGEYVAWQDSDDISPPDRLDKQARFLQSNPAVGAVGVHAHVASEDMQPMHDRVPPVRHAEIILNHFVGDFSEAYVHAALMTRRKLLLEAGGYDFSLAYCSDCDLMTRLLGRTKFANIPEYLYIHRRRPGQRTTHDNPKRDRDIIETRQRRYERLWGERAPEETLDRLFRIRRWSKLTWRERRAAKRDITRIIDAMIAAEWVDSSDRPLLIDVMNRRLELVSPRLWQKFCYWRRHNFGGTRSERHLA